MRRALAVLLLVGALAGTARAQHAMAPAARAQLERGLRAYGEHDWNAAIEAFRAGYAIDPHPDFLFPWAQATRLSGDCTGALPLYRRALEAASADQDRADIEKLIARCEEEVARQRPPPEPEPVPAPEPPPPRVLVHPTSRAVTTRPATPWYRDRPGGALALGGAIALGGGVAFLIAAKRADDDAASTTSLDDFVAASDRADQHRMVGAIALGAGAGIAAVALLRYAWVAHRDAREPTVAVIAPAPGGGALVGLAGHF